CASPSAAAIRVAIRHDRRPCSIGWPSPRSVASDNAPTTSTRRGVCPFGVELAPRSTTATVQQSGRVLARTSPVPGRLDRSGARHRWRLAAPHRGYLGMGACARSRPEPAARDQIGVDMAIDERAVATTNGRDVADADLSELLRALRAAREGDFTARLTPAGPGVMADLAAAFNGLMERNDQMTREVIRVGKIVGLEGRMTERAALGGAGGSWAASVDSLNALIDDLVRPTTEVARVLGAVADGDLSQKMALTIGGQPVKGEFLRIGTTVNTMVEQLRSFAAEVTRVAREVGTEGK